MSVARKDIRELDKLIKQPPKCTELGFLSKRLKEYAFN